MSGSEKTRLHARVIKVDPDEPDLNTLRDAADIIKQGGLVAFPTETVYGLGANALDKDAVAKIFQIKKRPSSDPIIVHISDLQQLHIVVTHVPEIALKLAEKFWPGPLTMIMKRSANVPPNVSAGLPTIAVRMPSNKIAKTLIQESGVPIAAPSANIFSRPSSTKAQHIIDDFSEAVDLIIDGGDSAIGLESTVINLTVSPPVLLRPGGTPLEALEKILPDIQFGPKYIQLEESKSSTSPGMLTKHYSPRAELLLLQGPVGPVRVKTRELIKTLLLQGKRVGVLLPDEDLLLLSDFDVEAVSLGSEDDLETVGRNLFAGMRELDQSGLDVILIRTVKSDGLGLAILDRMIRASEGKVVKVT